MIATSVRVGVGTAEDREADRERHETQGDPGDDVAEIVHSLIHP
jgi:hypothetical protein